MPSGISLSHRLCARLQGAFSDRLSDTALLQRWPASGHGTGVRRRHARSTPVSSRPCAVWLCRAGTGLRPAEKLFIGWFGPRGLASIVFGILIFDADLPNGDTVIATAVVTILLSVVLHGVTANPLVRALARQGTPAP